MKRFGLVCLMLVLLGPWRALAAEEVTLMTHDSFNVSEDVIKKFEEESGIKVRFLKSGDAGTALVQAILSKENPMADVFFGVDNTFFSRAIKADIFEPYAARALADMPDFLKIDAQNRLLPVDYGDVCLNFDRAWFTEKKISPPKTLDDLIRPAYKNLAIVENPATSSPGLAFLLATIGRFGADGYLDYWKKLRENGVLVTKGWEDAYYGHFSAASKGDRPLVVSYASSPAATVHFSETPLNEAPTRAVLGEKSAFRQIEFVGILKGTRHLAAAQKLVDFMLCPAFQEDIPLQMFMFPANRKAKLPEVFDKYASVAEAPAKVLPAAIEANRDKWIKDWTNTVLR